MSDAQLPQVSRLFDAVTRQLAQSPKKGMLHAKEGGSWRPYSTKEVWDASEKLAAGLLRAGIGGGDLTDSGTDKVAIISNNRPEWVITDLAVQQTGAVLVPLYPTTGHDDLDFILHDAAVKCIFVSDAHIYSKILGSIASAPALKFVFSFDHIDGIASWTSLTESVTNEDISALGLVRDAIKSFHLATIIYTSGTTGTPKGVMLTHENIISNVTLSKKSFPFRDDPSCKVLSFLPLNHIFERCVTYIYIFSSNSIYYAESLDTIGANLKEISPDGFTTVPRLLEKVFERIMAAGAALKGVKHALFNWALKLAEQYDVRIPGSPAYRLQLALARRLVFSKWREALGGRVRFIVTGGAACQEKLLRIFTAAGIPVFEGYGPTENSPVVSVNRISPGGVYFGTVGPPIDGIEVRLAGDGEILVKGSTVMKGYYQRPDLTAEVIKDGWLYTGDIGEWIEGDFLRITDRKKELFKTSGGKYVAPQPIENKLRENPYIEQAMVIGANRKFVAALIVPSVPALKTFLSSKSVTAATDEETVAHPAVQNLFKSIIATANERFNHVEQIKSFRLLPAEWTVDGGELTPKMSVRRKVVLDKYAEVVEGIYA